MVQTSVTFGERIQSKLRGPPCINALLFVVGSCVCVCARKCAYPHLTDPLSESGAALRINTDTLSAQAHTRTHTFYTHRLICQLTEFSPAPWVLFPAKQMVNIQNESRS